MSIFKEKCHTLPVPHRIKYKMCYYKFKIIHGLTQEEFSELFHRHIPNRTNLRSGSDKTRITTESEEGTIARSLCDEWNKLPRDGQDLDGLDIFKKNLKNF